MARPLWVWAPALLAGAVVAGPPESPAGTITGLPPFPDINLPDRARGEEAIALLGDRLPAVAAQYGMSIPRFARILRSDPAAWIDRRGRLLFIDQFPEQAGEIQQTDPLQSAPFPLSETFNLDSRPGARRTIYLDFDGHVTSGTAWNSSYGVDPIVSPSYSLDSDPAFSDRELENIQAMWRQVAEDFAPFEVNVTTRDPGQEAITRSSSGDPEYGTRVVITRDNFADCGCGGFAYVTAFNDIGDGYKPAFVFNTSLVGAGEAITHEAGHNLGLSHDGVSGGAGYYTGHGSGATGWAPIMGVGYYQSLVQWSQGEYSGANNTEDDIARIQIYGAPLMPDDHGDSASAATPLAADPAGTGVTGQGMIRRRDDVDVFSFLSGAGPYNIAVEPAPVSPNLDVRADLYDGAGQLVASANPPDGLSASLSGVLPAGEYFLNVYGTGKGDPQATGYSDYGSLGRFSVNGTVTSPGSLTAPVAVAAAPGYEPGFAPLYVGFDGGDSSDADGNIVAWSWDFGDGSTGSGRTVNHSYQSPGNYVVALTVTDDDNLTDSDSITIVVDNRPPVAVAGADNISGTAPFTVNFTGAGSYDPDSSGSIVSWVWDFGDGTGSNEIAPSHTYATAGTLVATLTVTDDLGERDSATVALQVAAPAYVDQYAIGEQAGGGTVGGSYLDTRAADGLEQYVRERESGGRKSDRYAFLEHTWIFEVQPGAAVTLSLTGRQALSRAENQMLFSYSVNGGQFRELPISLDDSAAHFEGLPLEGAEVGGELRIRVIDGDRSVGTSALDTVYIDQLQIRTHASGLSTEPPAPASALTATAISASQIDLSWSDNADNESGFRIERSLDGAAWEAVGLAGADQESFSDTGLDPDTQYHYRVVAYLGLADAIPSGAVTARTSPAGDLTLSASGFKVKGLQWARLEWPSGVGVAIYRDSVWLALSSEGSFEDEIGQKGSGTYLYQVCREDGSECSEVVPVVF